MVYKRDGQIQEFRPEKIENAVLKAFYDVEKEETEYAKSRAKEIAENISALDKDMEVEEIQDIVESQLAKKDMKVARKYIIYRNDRTRDRRRRSELMKQFSEKLKARGNICPVTIIMPTLAMETKVSLEENNCFTGGKEYDEKLLVDSFMEYLDKKIDEAKDMLIERYLWICKQSPDSAKFMYENFVMEGFDGKNIESAMKHGTLAVGQIGLAETLQILVGCNHTTKKGMETAKRIEQLFKDRCAEYKKEYSLNFGVYYTPAENLCFTAMSKFRNKYGEIPNVSDKKFFTNSMHVPVWEEMSPFEKIDIEAELTGYSSAGCITYVELPSSVKQNIDALEEIVNYAMDKDIPYFAVNVPNDMCTECGYTDEIGDECPICGCRKIRRLRRVTGYLTGDYIEAFNEGKRQEVDYRVKHFNNALKAKTEKNESH